ncbi:MAG TPA: menaquinone biosynthesis protein [Pyrinomonadaceae bacterium]|jgi:chorismate dehydratase|nr:menaquinone biosynthesis protein [Pyrinomonadaceae bacterium]
MTTPFRLAASSYLNSAPLIWSFLKGSKRGHVDFVEAVPARCAELLAEAEVEGALVPVIEYQRIAGGALVGDVCVGSQKEVLSVVLVSKDRELEHVRSVALDESSRTSATLVKIIFREFLDHEPAWTTRSPNLEEMLERNDAALIIGDPGMTFPRTGLRVWDMASLWRKYTGLGFVFAMWMVRDDAVDKARAVDFAGARDEGVAHVEQIIESYKEKIPMSLNELRKYLTENIVFRVDDSMQRGLQLYYELAFKHKLIDLVKPLRFV